MTNFFFRTLAPFFGAFFLALTTGVGQGCAFEGERRLSFYEIHTHEHLSVIYKKNGVFQKKAIAKLNHFLRDWRTNASIKMDPCLFDVLWRLLRDLGTQETIQVVSGYRSPKTNEKLRKATRGVAKNSRHMKGDAIDFYLLQIPAARVRAAAMRLQEGGVGYYKRSDHSFVHIDLGRVRSWPRMSRKSLEALFPEGSTVHLPADGGAPLKNYTETKERIARKQQRKTRCATELLK